MLIGLCVRVSDSVTNFAHSMDVSMQSDKAHTRVHLSQGVTLLILTQPIRFFFSLL